MEYPTHKAKKILNVYKHPDGGWYWTHYSAYPYIGCGHDCIYCYNQTFKRQNTDIRIKENAVKLLRKELSRVPKDVITVGSYQPIETKHRLIRKCLQVVAELGFPFHGIEKSDLIAQDLNLLKKINRKSWACVSFSFSTANPQVAQIFEPRCPSPKARFKAMKKLANADILTGTTYMPVLPFIADDDESLEEVVKATQETGGKYILFAGLTLNEPFRERYLSVVAEHYPDLLSRYEKLYHDAGRWGFGPTAGVYYSKINRKVNELCEKYSLLNYIPRYISPEAIRSNYLIAEKVYLKARELQMRGANFYQVLSYQRAAWALDALNYNIKKTYQQEGKKGLQKISGVGPKMAAFIEEIIGGK